MDINSTLTPPLHSKSSTSKLPIKRRTPDPPLKFHRIWTEPDEILFLQGLLDCNLSFPRDLGIFYARFSNTMSQPYTKSQLSEKLRRLRKKFRVISTRLSKGMDYSQLSLHDRALFDLAKRLWHPDHAATSPFNGARNVGGFTINKRNIVEGEKPGLVGIKVDFSPTIPVTTSGFEFDDQETIGNDFDNDDDDDDDDDVKLELDFVNDEIKIHGDEIEGGIVIGGGFDKRDDQEFKLSEVNVELEGAMEDEATGDFREAKMTNVEDKVGEVAAKAVMGIFEEKLNDLRHRIEGGVGYGERSNVEVESFHVRWQRQRINELDVLGKRLRLLLENSLRKQ